MIITCSSIYHVMVSKKATASSRRIISTTLKNIIRTTSNFIITNRRSLTFSSSINNLNISIS